MADELICGQERCVEPDGVLEGSVCVPGMSPHRME